MTARFAERRVVWRRKTSRFHGDEYGFRCVHCRQYVSTDWLLSGVRNRNHCPYCLHSRHLDWLHAGDRLAACKGNMLPVGLTLKRRHKKYGDAIGELMLVHRCAECGKLSINRIAADDDSARMLALFERLDSLDQSTRTELEAAGIQPLDSADLVWVQAQLFGKN